MRQWLLALLLLVLLFPAAAMAEDTTQAHPLDREMAAMFARYQVRGGVVVVAKGDEIVYQYADGYAVRKPQTPVTLDTRFRIASVSKLVTAVGVMQLVEQGALELDGDISAYFGGTLRHPSFPDTPITPRMIMTHTSSLRPSSEYKRGAKSVTDMLDTKNGRKKNFFTYRPGTRYTYSNFNGGMLGALIEAGSGMNVTRYMQQNVFGPLGIDGAYSVSGLARPELAADVFNANGTVRDKASRLAAEPFDETCDPQHHYDLTTGSLWISGPDLCRIGMLLCNRGRLNGVRILREETVLEMEADQQGRGGISCETPYGLNVDRVDNLVDGVMIYGHQGLTGAALCTLYYDPSQELTFVLITNGCDNRLTDHIANFSRRAFLLCRKSFYTQWEDVQPGMFLVTDDGD